MRSEAGGVGLTGIMTGVMRFVTYNVNSLKARLPRLQALIDEHDPDVLCLQETKAAPEAFPHLELRALGYESADHSGGRWAGVAVLAKAELGMSDVTVGLEGEPDPEEARWVEATVGGVRVVSVYVPNGRAVGTETFEAKLRFLEAMADRAAELADRPTFIAGDMNVCPTDRDVWNPAHVHGSTHITPAERSRLQGVLERGFVDVFRSLEPEEPGFTWWDYRAGHFHKGFGLRIDLALLSTKLAGGLSGARVDREFRKPTRVPESKPSDHAPLIVEVGGGIGE